MSKKQYNSLLSMALFVSFAFVSEIYGKICTRENEQ